MYGEMSQGCEKCAWEVTGMWGVCSGLYLADKGGVGAHV